MEQVDINMDNEKYIELFSQARLNGYSSIDEHEQNFKILDKIASKLGRIEIIIRNRIDRKMCQKDKDWLFHLPNNIDLEASNETKDHDILVSRQTFGFWIKVARHYKIEPVALEKDFLDNFSFKKYYYKNKERLNKTELNDYQKACSILLLTKNIRNRAFHFENLLKLRKTGIPRLSVRVDLKENRVFYFSIEPNMIIEYLDDILESFNK
ncbi:hypothetical protein [Campylobacter devanensis]|uniref:hypothetical protein n=1 Tax=Campylobacter devanensis TaxID=3161138 RepID=UPI00112FB20B|nr:hypothetical protein [Campylobacter sp. P0139]